MTCAASSYSCFFSLQFLLVIFLDRTNVDSEAQDLETIEPSHKEVEEAVLAAKVADNKEAAKVHPSRGFIPAFLKPYNSTTMCCWEYQFSEQYRAVIQYYTTDEIRDKIVNFDSHTVL